jgi:hypothetical protein
MNAYLTRRVSGPLLSRGYMCSAYQITPSWHRCLPLEQIGLESQQHLQQYCFGSHPLDNSLPSRTEYCGYLGISPWAVPSTLSRLQIRESLG